MCFGDSENDLSMFAESLTSFGAGAILYPVLTMTAGNLVALVQNNIKRMLAWSSIAHAGYLMLGVVTLISPSAGGSLSRQTPRRVPSPVSPMRPCATARLGSCGGPS